MGSDPSLPALEFMLQHVLLQLSRHRSQPQSAPLIVGVQGPQGSGKTFLTTLLRNKLSAEPHNLAVALLSIDDLYLPHEKLVELARSHPDNALLKGRGQPGTHDVPLGTQVLHSLKKINEPGAEPVMLPIFEKSLHGGEGDRLPEGLLVHGPLDVVILEGWCTGFYPTPAEEIERRWTQPVIGLDGSFSLEKYRKEDIFEINKMLESYVGWWELFNTFIQVSTPDVIIFPILNFLRSSRRIHRLTYSSTNGA